MKKNIWLVVLVLLAVTIFGVMSWSDNKIKDLPATDTDKKTVAAVKKTKPIPVVSVESVKICVLEKTIDETGTVVPTRTARIASPGEGPIEICQVREGDWINKGEMLVELGRQSAIEAQRTAARQVLKEQELELARVEKLVNSGAVPGEQLDTAKTQYENARAQLSKTEENHSDYTIIAPWRGIVSKVHVAEGDYVVPRTNLIEIFDPKSLVIQFSVPEAQSTEVQVGQSVQVQLDAYPNKLFHGKTTRVYPQLDTKTRTRMVETTLMEPVKLLPGMFVRLKILIKQIPNTITIPFDAVRQTADRENWVFLYKDDKAVKLKVQLGLEDRNRVQIVQGLQFGDIIIVAGGEKLKPGAKVRINREAR